ncbi:MAG: ribonuclease III domain-containing protein [Firmicutes bacterium]|nr:ribonuclease III domain-containing protein [Bacillota bacterium]MDD4263738.1 ribonuclease III domain-containing protein [Bacillota bacterium]MDD4693091.1 ribonuclease III domain-containing protein [Bacillota bacterium]
MDVESYSPLAWAYLGDGLWELFVRQNLMQESLRKAGDYHNIAVPFASAKTQAQIIKSLWDDLPEKEKEIFRRGRNSCSSYRKNATHQEYSYSTGFEAILGYLYLADEKTRLKELMEIFFAKGKEVLENGRSS